MQSVHRPCLRRAQRLHSSVGRSGVPDRGWGITSLTPLGAVQDRSRGVGAAAIAPTDPEQDLTWCIPPDKGVLRSLHCCVGERKSYCPKDTNSVPNQIASILIKWHIC